MPNLTSLRFCQDDLSLDAITTKVQQGEKRVGPLLAISPCEEFPPKRVTCFTHEEANASGQDIELRLCPPGGAIPTIPGKSVVCVGRCFVEGKLKRVAAFR